MPFSQEHRSFILKHYFASRFYALVKDEFRRNYPDEVLSHNSTISGIIARFREYGSVADKKRTERPAILTTAKLEKVRNVTERSPSKSIRKLSAESQISQFFGERIIYTELWSPRSPDLTSQYFFLLGCLNGWVYKKKTYTLEEVKRNITLEINNISVLVLMKVEANMVKRVRTYITERSSHFQHMLQYVV
ncbi:hypothetical protein C0J52_23513 [Blattella germanica]|nr:hypothetical protein C0J52_23513 [Blattella germanica]